MGSVWLKEMLPILDKPLIQYGVEEAADAGLRSICFVTGRGKRAIEDHFDVNVELENSIAGTGKEQALAGIRELIDQCSFSYTRQRQMLGLGHAILTGRRIIGNEPFGVILADDLCLTVESEPGVMAQMSALYEQHRCSIIAIEEVPVDQVDRYGVVAGDAINTDLMRVKEMVEKPTLDQAPSNLAIIGRYILTPDIFDVLENIPAGRNGEVQITDALLQQAQQGKVVAYKFKGRRIDCGTVDGFVEATNYCFELMDR